MNTYVSEIFWPDGKLKRRVTFVNDLRHGKDEIWNEAGLLVDTAEFKEGRPVGIHRLFSDDGFLIEEIDYGL